MSVNVEFGNGLSDEAWEAWSGASAVNVKRERVLFGPQRVEIDCITLTDSEGHELRGTPQGMRRLAFVLLGMTDKTP